MFGVADPDEDDELCDPPAPSAWLFSFVLPSTAFINASLSCLRILVICAALRSDPSALESEKRDEWGCRECCKELSAASEAEVARRREEEEVEVEEVETPIERLPGMEVFDG